MCYLFIEDGPGKEFRNAYNWLYRADDGVFEKELGRRFESSGVIAFLHFFSYIIVMNTIIPISLYICVEMIRGGQSMMIEWDEDMVDPATGNGTLARTTSINEDLGQIDHVFSDKTGTLTQNVMVFRRCSIGGVVYGEPMAGNDYQRFLLYLP
jgi:magnesium-transporting ATPase (P-type)